LKKERREVSKYVYVKQQKKKNEERRKPEAWEMSAGAAGWNGGPFTSLSVSRL
jgi:hypothetical protein